MDRQKIEKYFRVRANNNAYERKLFTFIDVIQKGGHIGLLNTTGVSQVRYNGNMTANR